MKPGYFFKRLFLFISFALASYIFLLIVFSHNFFKNKIPNLHNFSTPREIKEFSELRSPVNKDIVFIGSSHAEFEPPVFQQDGIKALNVSISSLRPITAYYFLKGEIQNISCKVIALETYYHLINEEYLYKEAILQIIGNEHMSMNFAQMTLASKDFAVINSGIGICFYHAFHPLNIMEPLEPETTPTATGKATVAAKLKDELSNIEPYTSPFTNTAIMYLQQSIDIIKNSGKKAMLIMAPVTETQKNKCLNYAMICNSLDSLAKKNDIPFLNYNTPENFARVGLSNDDFYDSNHLTKNGKEKFSKTVSQDLKKLNIF